MELEWEGKRLELGWGEGLGLGWEGKGLELGWEEKRLELVWGEGLELGWEGEGLELGCDGEGLELGWEGPELVKIKYSVWWECWEKLYKGCEEYELQFQTECLHCQGRNSLRYQWF